MAPLNRDKRVNLQASAAEVEMLRKLADLEGVSMSDYIRQQIRRAYVATFGEQPAKATKKKGKR